ncbi:hypothetical protein BJ742DRAFT_809840 [Cladochytrium replicatum]|nr:hypothetical protein BJ742DRAFT_809840 [Cladochytrium replicatum]
MGQPPIFLSGFPLEMLLRVATHLPLQDRLVLSSTSSHFRRTLAPTVFRAISFTNLNEFDTNSFDRVTFTYGNHVQHLRFKCLLFPNRKRQSPANEQNEDQGEVVIEEGMEDDEEWDDEEEEEEEEIIDEDEDGGMWKNWKKLDNQLSETAISLLQGKKLPHVRSFTVEFVPERNFRGETWVHDEYDVRGTIYISQAIETMEDVAASETEFLWRSTMAEVWRAIALNPSITSLEIRALPPNYTTAWYEAPWVNFLSRLERLSIGLWGGDNSAGWRSNTTDGYIDFLSGLKDHFYNHAQNLQSLEIIADAGSAYGGSEFLFVHYSPLNFGVENMPKLRQVRLHNCFHDELLREFIRGHSTTLESVDLVNCRGPGMEDSEVTSWADLFEATRRSKPLRLNHFAVTNGFVPMTHEEEYGQISKNPDKETKKAAREAKMVRERMKADPSLKLFHYGYVDDKYGMVFSGWDVIVKRFKLGKDQIEYNLLMDLVKENIARTTL